MLYVFYLQNTEGLIVTGMTSQIHDGLYLANLVFLVGVAAGAVTIVFPGLRLPPRRHAQGHRAGRDAGDLAR